MFLINVKVQIDLGPKYWSIIHVLIKKLGFFFFFFSFFTEGKSLWCFNDDNLCVSKCASNDFSIKDRIRFGKGFWKGKVNKLQSMC